MIGLATKRARRFNANADSLCAQSRQTVIMKRPYRDVLVWLAGTRPPDNSLSAERAIAAVIALLAAYDRDPKLAARWEERLANPRINTFPFGLNANHRNILRIYLKE
jgi:hypothetical protein